ncbi:DNA-3-methyladenine glycosylase [Streptomyces actuosus]|uniref:DNA-3-methyladenine glycosylase n=1 Tax=Streptomyces actuosus TaxID=1885 RepID=A0ABS2W0Q2_STRAS|nr:DNA-3-methyladenine glycosylase [Streptomyces actuosus]
MIATHDRTPLAREFLDRPVLQAVPDLLSRLPVGTTPEGPMALRRTEVAAHDGLGDPGSHACRGRTPRNGVTIGPPGRVYVYFTYGMPSRSA